ncbi:hypothetical protein N0V82_001806 [Gnomoniopsis sp. IMI 355080]|nr:hypothetical protein N0V82_001806 [Gnomoniopsis sp. IMI 355080]
MPEPRDKAVAGPAAARPESNGENSDESKAPSVAHRIVKLLTWCPPRCRWDPDNPPEFSMALNILFGFSGAFTVANLYYNHPILNILATDFDVPYEKVAQIPTAMQAGYAAGLLFLIGLCVTTSFATFTGISFITAVTTVTPQIMLPLVGDLAPPERRASSLSIVVSGFMLGILVARVLSGTVTNYTSWRNV